MTFAEKVNGAVEEYLRRQRMKNLSPRTVTNYRRVLRAFADYVAETNQPDEFVGVVAWKTELFERNLAPSTINQYMTDLQTFFAHAAHRSFPQEIRFGDNPIDKTLFSENPERPYEIVLTDEQVKMLYKNEPPAPRFKPTWERNWCMIQLCLNEKIRNAELLDLRLSDVDMHDHILVVQSGKGRKYREVDLCELSEFALTQYLGSGIRPSALSEDDYLFGTDAAHEFGNVNGAKGKEKWHRGTGAWLSATIERTVAAITGVHDCRSHDLRHVGSRVCLNAGQSMEELQGQLGHAQIGTTQIYCSRMGSKRSRDSARSVLAARDEAAKQLNQQMEMGAVIALHA